MGKSNFKKTQFNDFIHENEMLTNTYTIGPNLIQFHLDFQISFLFFVKLPQDVYQIDRK